MSEFAHAAGEKWVCEFAIWILRKVDVLAYVFLPEMLQRLGSDLFGRSYRINIG